MFYRCRILGGETVKSDSHPIDAKTKTLKLISVGSNGRCEKCRERRTFCASAKPFCRALIPFPFDTEGVLIVTVE